MKTDDQTENINKVIKNYLCAYINYMQNDWVDNLLIAEFVENNYINMSTKIILCFMDYKFHFQTSMKLLDIYKSE